MTQGAGEGEQIEDLRPLAQGLNLDRAKGDGAFGVGAMEGGDDGPQLTSRGDEHSDRPGIGAACGQRPAAPRGDELPDLRRVGTDDLLRGSGTVTRCGVDDGCVPELTLERRRPRACGVDGRVGNDVVLGDCRGEDVGEAAVEVANEAALRAEVGGEAKRPHGKIAQPLLAHGAQEDLDLLAERRHGLAVAGQRLVQGAELRAEGLAVSLLP